MQQVRAIKSAILAKRSRQIPKFRLMPLASIAQREQPVSRAAWMEAVAVSGVTPHFYIMPGVISENMIEMTRNPGRQP
jgi:hypothetical protein